ncbi:MAG: cellulase family glycosylhydrolase [Erysipelotrichaceae bacterium]|nr:cellulase family glycosylhydrolase [Erysipelotrichaceae bacterium]MBR4122741.1 cellulase family glycosylhydrolase [Erysipelotrichaceae bacterium]
MKRFEGFQHGIDLGGWLSQCDHKQETYEQYIKEEDFARIASWGLDHVRIPLDYELFEDEQGNYREEGFALLLRAVGWAENNGLNTVLDLHKTCGFSFDAEENEDGFFTNEEYQERFYRLWEKLARTFADHRGHIAFELLNEVTRKEDGEAWNRISKECVTRLRRIVPDIPILLGGYYNNSIEALKDLWVPEEKDNVVYNFHCYEPLVFTHQGAYWIPSMDTSFRTSSRLTYGDIRRLTKEQLGDHFVEETDFPDEELLSSAYFDVLFKEAVSVAEERNVALYCGEYGVVDRAAPEDILAWYKMISPVFEKYGIGRAAWNYRGKDFGFVDEHMQPVLKETVALL